MRKPLTLCLAPSSFAFAAAAFIVATAAKSDAQQNIATPLPASTRAVVTASSGAKTPIQSPVKMRRATATSVAASSPMQAAPGMVAAKNVALSSSASPTSTPKLGSVSAPKVSSSSAVPLKATAKKVAAPSAIIPDATPQNDAKKKAAPPLQAQSLKSAKPQKAPSQAKSAQTARPRVTPIVAPLNGKVAPIGKGASSGGASRAVAAPQKVAGQNAAQQSVAPGNDARKTSGVSPRAGENAAKTAVSQQNAPVVAPRNAASTRTPPRVLARPHMVVEAPKTVMFSNGARLVTRPDRAAPLVVVSLLVRAGAADESAANAGWRRFLVEAMLRASSAQGLDEKSRAAATAGFLSGTQIQTRADDLGGRLGASVGDDAIEIWASGPSENAAQLTDLLLAVALHPRLDESDVAAARDRVLLRSDDAQDDASSVATTALRAQLYRDANGRAAAYALPLYGTASTLESLSRDGLRALHARFFVPSRIIVASAGDVNAAALQTRIASLAASASSVSTPPPFLAQSGKNEPPLVVRQVPSAQAWVFVSYRVAGADSADLPALRVLAAALGEARGARLPNRLLGSAKPESLSPARRRAAAAATASQVSVSFTPRRYGTEFIALAQTDGARIESVKNAMLDEIRKLRDAPLSQIELSRARDFVLGSFAVDREGLRERAYLAALATSYAPGNAASTRVSTRAGIADLVWPSRVSAVTRADVQRVARKYLANYAVALIMPSE